MTKKTALILTTIFFLIFLGAYLWFYGRFGRYLLRLMFGVAAFNSIWPATALFLLTILVIVAHALPSNFMTEGFIGLLDNKVSRQDKKRLFDAFLV
jgi:hypothetical protein